MAMGVSDLLIPYPKYPKYHPKYQLHAALALIANGRIEGQAQPLLQMALRIHPVDVERQAVGAAVRGGRCGRVLLPISVIRTSAIAIANTDKRESEKTHRRGVH